MAQLEVKNLQTFFHTREGVVRAVDDISFEINRGEIVGLVGESGSGKSVTCHSILQLLPSPPAQIEGGTIRWKNDHLFSTDKPKLRGIRGKEISMIFQDPMSCLNPYLPVVDQVAEPLIIHGIASAEKARKQALEIMSKVGIKDMQKRINAYPHEFSGGMRQRAMIAMALITNPDLLLADEPTTALDVTVQAKILRILKELCKELDVSVLFVTHDLAVVSEIADRVLVMYKGKLVEQNDTASIFNSPKHPYVKALIACRPTFKTKVGILPTVSDFLNQKDSSSPSIQNENLVSDSNKTSKKNNTEDLIVVKDLKVHFSTNQGTIKAVDGVNFSIQNGTTMGLVGESGCGKTTLGRAILRLVKITDGQVLLDRQDIANIPRHDLAGMRKFMQIIFQDPYASLNPRLTIEQAIIEPMKVHKLIKNDREGREKAVELLEEVGLLADHLSRYPHEFSGGQRQRICVARALAPEPSFVVCDECVSAMDVSVQAQVLNLLRELQQKRNLTYLFISHDLSVVKFISDDMIVMKNGKIMESGNAQDIYENPKSNYTRELLDAVPSAALTG
tara:strand:+ start:847 stop:2532 length:1686 start_codon:yes stop_codon:yes gene_type:complete